MCRLNHTAHIKPEQIESVSNIHYHYSNTYMCCSEAIVVVTAISVQQYAYVCERQKNRFPCVNLSGQQTGAPSVKSETSFLLQETNSLSSFFSTEIPARTTNRVSLPFVNKSEGF
ncbi:hypothetical protein AMECASPLE_001672 [Ameca splendens]|uniref:Uncharacterized protein n=1 Tax=Ameca splendens TaxID=208324 RepID=A0ABV0XAL6_9TELE